LPPSYWITSRVFNDNVLLFVCLLIGIVVLRGLHRAARCRATDGLACTASMVGAEGVVRLVAYDRAGSLSGRTLPACSGWRSCSRRSRRCSSRCAVNTACSSRPTAPYAELSSVLSYLLVGLPLCQAISYSGYLAAVVLHNSGQKEPRR
jgi:hypothetical protein